MLILVAKGIGTGPTELAAFDQALVHAGVANYNLIYLSSVLPPESEIVVKDEPFAGQGKWGDRLYVVMAQNRTQRRNKEVWAGIGWIQDEKTGKGLLVEHEGGTEPEVRADIEHSLQALANNRGMQFGPINMVVNGTRCKDLPVCALVVAVFESSGWKGLKKENNFSLSNLSRRRKN